MQPFTLEVAQRVETDLRALLSYYGENLNSPEGPKPDDFFGMIHHHYKYASFTVQFTGQKAALEIHDRQKKVPALAQGKMSSLTQSSSEEAPHDPSHDLPIPSTEHSASIGRGDLEEAMRSLREGRKRCRPPHSITGANKIFLDGRPELS